MPRHRVDLRVLPRPVLYMIAAAVMTPIVLLAWVVGQDQPTPDWITQLLIPALGALLMVAVIVEFVRGFREGRRERGDGE